MDLPLVILEIRETDISFYSSKARRPTASRRVICVDIESINFLMPRGSPLVRGVFRLSITGGWNPKRSEQLGVPSGVGVSTIGARRSIVSRSLLMAFSRWGVKSVSILTVCVTNSEQKLNSLDDSKMDHQSGGRCS
jgi:hypothetical protein